jgi:hypothetical protein
MRDAPTLNSPAISTVRDLIALWPSHKTMADDLDLEEYQPRDWARRGRIPAQFLHPIVNAAQRRGFHHVTHEFLTRLVAEAARA